MKIGVVGVGGLGTMGIKIASALGHHVVAISSNESKRELALSKGASDFVVSTDGRAVYTHTSSLDLVLNTVCVPHNLHTLLGMVATNGTLVQLGSLGVPQDLVQFMLIPQRKSVAGSLVGGMKALQECVDFCIEKGIYPEVEVVDSTQICDVFVKLDSGNSEGVRFVLDIEASSNK